VSGFGQHARWLELSSDRFDHSSEVPPEYNAGNRFYGRDVAELIADRLAGSGYETTFFDEDWGWMARAWQADGPLLEIAVYHDLEDEPGTEDSWQLMVRSLDQSRWLGLVPRRREIEVDPDALEALEGVFEREGISVSRRQPL